jgi:hypothetical protein
VEEKELVCRSVFKLLVALPNGAIIKIVDSALTIIG